MTFINRIRLTRWADKTITGEIPVGTGTDGNPVWGRLSGRSIGIILGAVKGADWEAWADTVTVDGKPQQVTRYRTARSWRMTADDSVVGRIDVLTVAREDVDTATADASLAGAVAVVKPAPRAKLTAGTSGGDIEG